jgi:hypothetical protein
MVKTGSRSRVQGIGLRNFYLFFMKLQLKNSSPYPLQWGTKIEVGLARGGHNQAPVLPWRIVLLSPSGGGVGGGVLILF